MADRDYLSLSIKRQALLESVKSGQVRDFLAELKNLEAIIREAILLSDEEISDMSRTKLNSLLSKLRADQAVVFKTATETFMQDASKLAALSASQEIIAITSTVNLGNTKIKSLAKKDLFKNVIQRPLTTNGDLLEPWLKDFSNNEINRINNSIRAGWAQGNTNKELVRQIIGTKANRYTDGILNTTRRNAEAVVRTSVQHVATAARHELWESNKDVVKQYQWLSTLDSVTSSICRSLDGQKFDFGKGPVPPAHPNCRSTTISVLDSKFDFIDKGATRSSADGPVDANTSYYDWLKRQDEKTQIDILGPSRAKLFRDGGMTAEKFRKLQFDKNFEPLTLKEMAKLEPEAFESAGLVD